MFSKDFHAEATSDSSILEVLSKPSDLLRVGVPAPPKKPTKPTTANSIYMHVNDQGGPRSKSFKATDKLFWKTSNQRQQNFEDLKNAAHRIKKEDFSYSTFGPRTASNYAAASPERIYTTGHRHARKNGSSVSSSLLPSQNVYLESTSHAFSSSRGFFRTS